MERELLRLQQIVGNDACLLDPDPADPRLTDERDNFHGRAAAIVSPKSTDEVSAIVATCAGAGIPIVPQGGNTGYCGAATPDSSGLAVLLSLSRMNRIRAIDVTAATMTADAGVVLAEAQAAAAAEDLLLPLAMGSQGSCQLGGNLSTNAGGLSVLRYGSARELVAGLEVVLPDGRVFSDLGGLRKDNTGYDLKQLFLGAEGTLGVITATVLRLRARPSRYLTAWIGIDGIEAALGLLATLRPAFGEGITSFEYIARDALALACTSLPQLRPPIDDDSCDHALVELAAFDDGATLSEAFEHALGHALETNRIRDAVVAQNESQRRELWNLRESIPAAEKRTSGSIKHDVSVSLGAMPLLAESLTTGVSEKFPGVRLSVYGHVGDGNLHFNVLSPSGDDPVAYRARHAEQISEFVHAATIGHGGSFSAEHGVGQLKRELLANTASPIALSLMRTLKRALDPNNIMNPGKVV